MRKMTALFVSMAFIFSTAGLALAQTSAPAPAPAPAPAATDKKTDDKSMDKKPAAKKMTMEEKKAACLEKAGTDEAKKTQGEKKFTAKNSGKKSATSGQAQAPASGEKKQ